MKVIPQQKNCLCHPYTALTLMRTHTHTHTHRQSNTQHTSTAHDGEIFRSDVSELTEVPKVGAFGWTDGRQKDDLSLVDTAFKEVVDSFVQRW